MYSFTFRKMPHLIWMERIRDVRHMRSKHLEWHAQKMTSWGSFNTSKYVPARRCKKYIYLQSGNAGGARNTLGKWSFRSLHFIETTNNDDSTSLLLKTTLQSNGYSSAALRAPYWADVWVGSMQSAHSGWGCFAKHQIRIGSRTTYWSYFSWIWKKSELSRSHCHNNNEIQVTYGPQKTNLIGVAFACSLNIAKGESCHFTLYDKTGCLHSKQQIIFYSFMSIIRLNPET